MTDKEYRRITKILNRLWKKWGSSLGFNRWKVKIIFQRELKEDNPKTAATCSAMWEYMDMLLTFYVPVMEDMDERAIEAIFVHECLHGLVNEMREWTPDRMYHEEHVITQLTQAMLWAKYDGRMEEKRKK